MATSRMIPRNYVAIRVGLIFSFVVIAACSVKETATVQMTSEVVIRPPELTSFEVHKADGQRLSDGGTVTAGETIRIVGRGAESVTGEIDAFGQQQPVTDSGDGLYSKSLEVPSTVGRSTVSLVLNDPEATPTQGKPMRLTLVVEPKPVVDTGPTEEELRRAALRDVQKRLGDSRVTFGFDSTVIGTGEASTIERWADIIKEAPGWLTFEVVGACDQRGPDKYNSNLGLRRAIAVRDALTRLDASPDRVRAETIGESNARDCAAASSVLKRRECYAADRQAVLRTINPQ